MIRDFLSKCRKNLEIVEFQYPLLVARLNQYNLTIRESSEYHGYIHSNSNPLQLVVEFPVDFLGSSLSCDDSRNTVEVLKQDLTSAFSWIHRVNVSDLLFVSHLDEDLRDIPWSLSITLK